MIPIYEGVMATSVRTENGLALFRIIQNKEFVDFIKSLYDDKYKASMDVAVAINNICDSAFANPVLCDLYKDGKKLNGWFIKINNEYYDLLTQEKFFGVNPIKNTSNCIVCITDNYWKVSDYLNSEYTNYCLNIGKDNIGE